ncbi:hypothetical protein PVK06_011910 [Gossypium arboreum]|uniref:Reverse transcriptase n=1 Tax=Gossypium arboreum TaxID=29729 RepID=A0ABR0Q9Y7_GOSAR|nr:hypothetical protein PVK06_011910 [Gossypium arboreum]
MIKVNCNELKCALSKNLEDLMAEGRDDDNLVALIDVKIQLNFELDKDEAFWEQRVRANWLRLGDKNTIFFHKVLSGSLEREDGTVASTKDEIGELATEYFQNLISSNGIGDLSHILLGINTSIFHEKNIFLLAKFTEEDVNTTLTEMRPTKALGFDGFLALFF